MRILKVANIGPGRSTGVGRVMHETADELGRMGHQVDLMFDGDVSRLGRGGPADRVTFPLALVRVVRQWMRDRGPYDVVEIHEPSAAAYALFRRRPASDLPPCALMSHGLEATAWRDLLALDRLRGRRTPLRNRMATPLTRLPIVSLGIRLADQVMCLNEGDRQYLLTAYGLNPDRITLVTNGVATDQAPAKAPVPPTDRSGPPNVLWVGTWLDKKGRREIVDTLSGLARAGDVRLSLLGTGFSAAVVLADFPEAVRSLVTVVPQFDEPTLRAAHAAHDVFVSAAFYEPWGLAIQEAAVAGMAIVTTDAEGPKQFLVDGESALFVPRADASALASAICRLIASPDLRRKLASAAAATASLYTWRRAAESHLTAYHRAIACGQRKRVRPDL